MEKTKYTECYVAFLDMLGFKKLIEDSSCDEIAEIFTKHLKRRPLRGAYLGNEIFILKDTINKLKAKVMSDSICFYIDVNVTNALLCIIMSCINFQYELYKNKIPIFIRGAIVRGHLYAEEDIIFGPGLTQAYLMEENNAKYPRIILTKDTLKFLDEKNRKDNIDYATILESIVFRDDDAFYTVNCMRVLWGSNQEIRENVENRIKLMLDSTTDSSVREKYLYLEKWMQREIHLSKIRNNPSS